MLRPPKEDFFPLNISQSGKKKSEKGMPSLPFHMYIYICMTVHVYVPVRLCGGVCGGGNGTRLNFGRKVHVRPVCPCLLLFTLPVIISQ